MEKSTHLTKDLQHNQNREGCILSARSKGTFLTLLYAEFETN